MVLAVCLFLVLCVLGINLLNAANAKTTNTALELQKEQTLLYVSSVYETVNEMVESGKFSDDDGMLPKEVVTTAGFQDGNGREIDVKLTFAQNTMPVRADMDITIEDEKGTAQTYTVITTYSNSDGGLYRRESCKGLADR